MNNKHILTKYFCAQSPETFTYDADGNMLKDGRFRYYWNAENGLVKAEELYAPTNREPYVITYAYDHKGRMVRKIISHGGTEARRIEYIWDNWNIIRETAADLSTSQPFNLSTDYVWGLDLDGTLQGAGGVGGLLAVVRDDGTYLPTYDANGNVSEYVNASDGSVAAHYDYSPFGEILMQDGDLANTFTHRFSTKPYCPITKLVEYQMRKYRPEVGRWLSRDAIGEDGGANILSPQKEFISHYDYLGLKCCLITMRQGGDSLSGHSILKCNNGKYISWNPGGWPGFLPGIPWPGQNHDEQHDFGPDGYGIIVSGNLMEDGEITTDKGRYGSVVCLDCVDDNKISIPNSESWWGGSWNPNNNCSDATLRAIDKALDDIAKPNCKCGYWPHNILSRDFFQTPQNTEAKIRELKERNCNKWECRKKPAFKHGK